MDIPAQKGEQTKQLWKWMIKNLRSDYIEFVEDGHYSANWDDAIRAKMIDEIINRLNSKKDVDLFIAMGTWAGKDLANNSHHTPTMVLTASDAVGAGIVKSNEDSGFDHVQAHVDPFRYERQVRLFHDLVGFKKLGVAYEDSIAGRSYASVEMIKKLSQEKGFEIEECYTKSDIADQDLAARSVINCFEVLSPVVDAIYVTVQGGINPNSIPKLVEIANQNKIPTFSQFGSKEVRYGFLMSISRAGGFKPEGRFLAATAAQIFNGAKPRDLTQVFEESPNIAINLRTAELIGFYLYADLLAAADEIYRGIETPK